MKRFCWLMAVLFGGAATTWGLDSAVSKKITKYCDPVCELRGQDAAFSMLVEAYRQFQSRLIERDYEQRLQAATNLSKDNGDLLIQTSSKGLKTLRMWVAELAKKERDLRMERLQVEVSNFTTAYGCARKTDEQATGDRVPNTADPSAASDTLKSFDIVALGSVASGHIKAVDDAPASGLFLDAERVPVPSDKLIEPCD